MKNVLENPLLVTKELKVSLEDNLKKTDPSTNSLKIEEMQLTIFQLEALEN